MDKNISKLKKLILLGAIGCMIASCCYYNILYDVFLILILFCASYIVGCKFNIDGNSFERIIIRTAVGMGVIGIAIYYILLLGIGSKSIYIALFISIFMIGMLFIPKKKQELNEVTNIIKGSVDRNWVFFIILLLLLTIYLIYGCSSLSYYDTMTKHLPITVYAAETGKWYVNVTESIVYGEPMVLQYTYSALFYTFGAYRALGLFNVILYFSVYVILCHFVSGIYPKYSKAILTIILLTTPFFFEFSTRFYLDILPIYFLFSAFVGSGTLETKKIWNNIEIIAFLCGCTIFAKLTPVLTIVIMVTVLTLYCVKYAIECKVVKQTVFKMIKCLVLGILPSITSLFYIWYKTGNPLFPQYNGIFKSPYFVTANFEDPYTNKLTFSLHSLIDIVFHTSQNIEMRPLGMGIFLLFIFVLPLAMFILIWEKNWNKFFNYLIWSMVATIAYILNMLPTYNLRYHFTVWILFACVIAAGISICLSVLPFKNIAVIFISVMLLSPNLYYINKYYSIKTKFIKDERYVNNPFCEVFNYIPKGKRILSFTYSNNFKGQYQGYFSSITWHSDAVMSKMRAGIYEWKDYLSSFDYILIDKTTDEMRWVGSDVMDLLPDFLGDKCFENNVNILYEVIPQKDTIMEKEYEEPLEISLKDPVTEIIENEKTEYYIKQNILNETGKPVTVSVQINWMTENGGLLETYYDEYNAPPGESEYYSDKIPANMDASSATINIMTVGEQIVKIQNYMIEGLSNVIDIENKQFKDRKLLNL